MDSERGLRGVQSALHALYRLDLEARIEDFVCDAETARALGGDEALRRREVLFVVEDGEDTCVGLYLDPDALTALDDPSGWDTRFGAMCLVAEGVSHFVYLHYRTEASHPVCQLELELQAEVDKYALGLLGGQGVGLFREALKERSRAVRRRLFDDAVLLDAEESEEGERYRIATRSAAKYVERLERSYVDGGHWTALARELRTFYRLGLAEKLARCERR